MFETAKRDPSATEPSSQNSSESPPGAIARAYDRVHYPRLAYHYSHPDRLATLARLFGLSPAPVERSRVLELGCASGANLIPLAEALPAAAFLGIDLSGGQIAEARSLIAAAGLGNVRCEQADILDFDPSSGEFDAIIAHGLYSWTPPAARAKVLEICGRHLAPQGVAYVSFNAYPGCHLRRMIREMARYHTRRIEEPLEMAASVRRLLPELLAATPFHEGPHGAVLREYQSVLDQMSDAGILHELLETENEPSLFVDFVAAAESHGLRYLTDATFADRRGLAIDRCAMLELRRRHGEVGCEQYLDFLTGQAFHRTLLVRADAPVKEVHAGPVTSLSVTSSARPVSGDADLSTAGVEQFQTRYGVLTTADSPLMKTALACLAEAYPRAIPFPTLLQTTVQRLGRAPTPADEQALAGELLGRFMLEMEVVGLSVWRPAIAAAAGDRPLASRVARAQAAAGWPIVGLNHMMAGMSDPAAGDILGLLDGAHDRAQLLAAQPQLTAERLEAILRELAESALLASDVES